MSRRRFGLRWKLLLADNQAGEVCDGLLLRRGRRRKDPGAGIWVWPVSRGTTAENVMTPAAGAPDSVSVMADVIVVGAGVVGLAAAYELGRAGQTVRVVSADVPGSRQSAGLSRIFRLAHADGPLTEAAARARGLWEEWEAAAGAPLLDRTGLLLTGDMSDREPYLRPFRRA